MPETLVANTVDPSTLIDHDFVVTNNAGTDIVALDCYNHTTGVQIMYEQTLTLLGASSSQSVIKSGTNCTLDLKDTHLGTDGKTTMPNLRYSLIFARADNMVPVKNSSVKLSAQYTADPQTVEAADAKSMQTAQQFYQTIMSFPTGTLAKGYTDAVNNAQKNGSSIIEMDKAVSDYLSANGYPGLTLEMVLAVSTYYAQFPYVWASFKSTKTYYLYSSDGSKIKDCGSIVLTISGSQSNPDKKYAGCTFTHVDPSGKKTPLTYANGQFVDDPNAYVPNICLAGMFVPRSTFTKNSDDNTIMTSLNGLVQGDLVLGYDQKQTPDSSGNWGGLYTLLHPKDAMGVIQLFMTIMGVVMGIDFIMNKLKGTKDKAEASKDANGGKDPDMNKIRGEMDGSMAQMKANNQKLLDKMNDKLQDMSDNVSEAIDNLKQQISEQIDASHADLLQESLNQQSELLDEMSQYSGENDITERLGDSIFENQGKLSRATTENRGEVVSEVKPEVASNNTDLGTLNQNLSERARTEVSESYTKAVTDQSKAKEASDELEKNKEDLENNKESDDVEVEDLG